MLMRIKHDANGFERKKKRKDTIRGRMLKQAAGAKMKFYNSIKYCLLLFRVNSLHISTEYIL